MPIDQPGIALHQVVRTDPYLDGCIDAHVGKENIGGIDQLKKNFLAAGRFQVHRDAALVAVVAFKIVVVPLETHGGSDETHEAARRIAFFGLDFDHIRYGYHTISIGITNQDNDTAGVIVSPSMTKFSTPWSELH